MDQHGSNQAGTINPMRLQYTEQNLRLPSAYGGQQHLYDMTAQHRSGAFNPRLISGDQPTSYDTQTLAFGNGMEQMYSPPPIVPQPTGRAPDKIFWDTQSVLHNRFGQVCSGTNAEIFSEHKDLQQHLWGMYFEWCQQQSQHQSLRLAQTMFFQTNNGVPATNVGGATSATGDQTVAPEKKRKRSMSPNLARKKHGGTPAALNVNASNIPSYRTDADLSSVTACREYLASVDVLDAQKLNIPGDDCETVKLNQTQHYIGQIFNSLSHPYDQNPQQLATVSKEKQEKYHNQQKIHTGRVIALLQTPSQVKAAKARCYLLFEAAVTVSERGVPRDMYAGYQAYAKNDRKPKKAFRLDVVSKCSIRLQKMVDIIKGNKLVAIDILKGENFQRIARDPDFYLFEKFDYLRSNTTRADKDKDAREGNEGPGESKFSTKAIKAKGRGRKRGHMSVTCEYNEADEASTEESDDEVGLDDDEDDYKPPTKHRKLG